MQVEQFEKSEISKWRKYKWAIQDVAGLQIWRFISFLSRDPEIKELYQDMREAIYIDGDQPEALRIGNEMKSKIMMNTEKRLNKL